MGGSSGVSARGEQGTISRFGLFHIGHEPLGTANRRISKIRQTADWEDSLSAGRFQPFSFVNLLEYNIVVTKNKRTNTRKTRNFGKAGGGWRVCRKCDAFRRGCGRIERRSGMCCSLKSVPAALEGFAQNKDLEYKPTELTEQGTVGGAH